MPRQTWLIIGASRGIGLQFTSTLLSLGHIVIATARAPCTSPPVLAMGNASKLWSLTGTPNRHNLTILECDVSSEDSIRAFVENVRKLGRKGCVLEASGGVIDVVVLNAGVLEYPSRISEVSFSVFGHHLNTNCIGPLVTASHLLGLSSPSPNPSPPITTLPPISSILHPSNHPTQPLPLPRSPTTPTSPLLPTIPIRTRTLVFISSDSGSAGDFRSHEDGLGAYSVSKAALNQGVRHLAAELHRKHASNSNSKPPPAFASFGTFPTDERRGERGVERGPVILAIHPGEVATDMGAINTEISWEVEGIISAEESVSCMLKVIEEKGWGGVDEGGVISRQREGRRGEEGEATFWDWKGGRYPW